MGEQRTGFTAAASILFSSLSNASLTQALSSTIESADSVSASLVIPTGTPEHIELLLRIHNDLLATRANLGRIRAEWTLPLVELTELVLANGWEVFDSQSTTLHALLRIRQNDLDGQTTVARDGTALEPWRRLELPTESQMSIKRTEERFLEMLQGSADELRRMIGEHE